MPSLVVNSSYFVLSKVSISNLVCCGGKTVKGRLQKETWAFGWTSSDTPPTPKLGPRYQVIFFIVLFKSKLLQTSKFLSHNCGSPTIPRKIQTLSSYSVMVFDIRIWLFWWRGGEMITFLLFIAFFHVLKSLNHFKAIKRYLITGLGPRPPALTSAKRPSLTFFFWSLP